MGPNWTPFIHYADYLVQAPHRYDKLFWGYIKDGEHLQYLPWIYSVRALIDEALPYAHVAGREAESEGIWKSAPLGRARVYTANCGEYFSFVMDKLSANKWYLAKGPAVDVIAKEHERVPYINPDAGMYAESGEWLGEFMVPERWCCKSAKLTDSSGNIISESPWFHSLSVDKEISREELEPHVSANIRNCFLNRDWGFVFDDELTDSFYHVKIESEFGKGKLSVQDDSIYIEEWKKIASDKSLKVHVRFGENYDWRSDV